MVQLCRVSGCCSAEWYFDCSFSFGLGCSPSSSLCSKPIWDNYNSSMLLINVLLPAVATGCWNIWSWLYGEERLKPYITVPYYKGLSESVKKKCSNYGVQVYFRGGTTIKKLLVAPKDKDPMLKKSGVIYSYKCGRVECDEEYIGESSRTFGERFMEHQKAPSPYLTVLTPLVTA